MSLEGCFHHRAIIRINPQGSFRLWPAPYFFEILFESSGCVCVDESVELSFRVVLGAFATGKIYAYRMDSFLRLPHILVRAAKVGVDQLFIVE
jgi:hypothetical protein